MSSHSERLIEYYSERLLRLGGYAREGFAAGYNEHRPSPPAALLDLLSLEARVERPGLVVDLGSGTGLSARAWADRADEVVGVDASPEMRALAEALTRARNIRYVAGFAHETDLPDAGADVVTCSQSFHWMEPEPTLAEVARILRPGGVFAAYDYDWPPIVDWEVEAAFAHVMEQMRLLRQEEAGLPRYPMSGHLERIGESGQFRHVREVVMHSRERATARRVLGMLTSLGPLNVLLQDGVGEDELGLTRLREVLARTLGDREVEMFLCYRVRLGVK